MGLKWHSVFSIFMKEKYINLSILPLGQPCNFVLASEIYAEFYPVRFPRQLLFSDRERKEGEVEEEEEEEEERSCGYVEVRGNL